MSNNRETFAALPHAESTLLWAIRVWVMGYMRQQDVSARIGGAFGDLGAERAPAFLEGFMWALSRGARRPLELLCLCRPEVSADERTLLDAFALLQQDEPAEARARLATLLSDQAAAAALRSAEGVADDFILNGILLSCDPAAEHSGLQPNLHRLLH